MYRLFFLLIIIIGCKATNPNQDDALAAAEDFLGDSYTTEENESKTFVIYTQSKDIGTNYPQVRYLIYDRTNNQVVEKGSIKQGYVKWISDTQIEIMDLAGLAQNDNNNKRIITTTN